MVWENGAELADRVSGDEGGAEMEMDSCKVCKGQTCHSKNTQRLDIYANLHSATTGRTQNVQVQNAQVQNVTPLKSDVLFPWQR